MAKSKDDDYPEVGENPYAPDVPDLGGAWFLPILLLASVVGLAAAFVLALVGFLLFFWPLVLASLWSDAAKEAVSHSLAWRTAATVFAGALGVCLYFARKNLRWFYGASEVVIGLAGCWVLLGAAQADGLAIAIGLSSAVYVIVRGLDNCEQGWHRLVAAVKRLGKAANGG